jgi:hypothetical protein
MKFLTISTLKDEWFELPPAMSRQLCEANIAYMKRQKQAGTTLEAYVIPGWRRSIIISEADSAEEIVKSFNEIPGAYLMDLELYPLADFEESMKYVVEALKRAEQAVPGPAPK